MTEKAVDLRQICGRRPKVAIAHPMLGRGGSEACLMWMIEALKRDCDITIITTTRCPIDSYNEFYGTAVHSDEVRIVRVPAFLPDDVSAAAWRGALHQRFLTTIAAEYDLRISAYNPVDWGAPAIHVIADFSWNARIRTAYDPPGAGFPHRESWLRRHYLAFCRRWERPNGSDYIGDGMVVANSQWSAQQVRASCGVRDVPVVYPPVWSEFPVVTWGAKAPDFVMIGRIVPEKRIETAVEVLGAVRAKGHPVKLHLCGRVPDDAYGRRIRALCRANREWIVVEGEVAGGRKAELLARCKYGIQMRTAEPFGIAVAEMVKAGAIVFAPRLGGQAEIVGQEELLFGSAEDAVTKICSVMNSAALQSRMSEALSRRTASFTPELFMAQFRNLVAEHACNSVRSEVA